MENPISKVSRRKVLAGVGATLAIHTGQTSGFVPSKAEKVEWTTTTGSFTRSPITVYEGKLYYGTANHLVASKEGTKEWEVELTDGHITTLPEINQSYVYVATYSRTFKISSSGDVIWSTKLGRGGVSKPAIVGDSVIVAKGENEKEDGGSKLVSLDISTGRIKWTKELQADNWSAPVAKSNTVYVGDATGHLYAVDIESGQTNWEVKLGEYILSSAIHGTNLIYVYSDDSRLHAVTDKGEHSWSAQLGSPHERSRPVLGDGVIYTGDSKGVHCINKDSGEVLWQFDTESPASMPAVTDTSLYFGTMDGKLTSIKQETGKVNWSIKFPAEIVGSGINQGIRYAPAFNSEQNAVYASSGNGRIYAIK